MPKGAIPWTTIKRLYCVDGLSAPMIEKHPAVAGKVTRQGILKRAQREGWLTPNEELEKRADETGLPAITGQMLKDLRSFPLASQIKLTALLDAFSRGASLKLAAAAVGTTFNTLKSWIDASPDFAMAIDQARASAALTSLNVIDGAQRRGDWKAAERLLSQNQLTKQDWAQASSSGGSGGPQLTVVFQLPRDGKTISVDHEPNSTRMLDLTAEEIE